MEKKNIPVSSSEQYCEGLSHWHCVSHVPYQIK